MFKKVISVFSSYLNKNYQFTTKGDKHDVVIVDDTMPDIYSGFKIQEFDAYSKAFNTKVVCDLTCFKENDPRKNFQNLLEEFSKTHEDSKINFEELKLFTNINSKIAYCLFFNNIIRYFDFFELKNIDFGYTLYPGGGLNFEHSHVKAKLKEIHSSKNFKFVIVNQGITKEFLVNNNLCDPSKIHYIHGTPIDFNHIKGINYKNWYGSGKETLDISFVAHKYTEFGKDKGLDILVDALDLLSERYDFLNLHIVGTFTEHDIHKRSDKWKCHFYGVQPLSYFSKFFANIDMIVSPNRPNGIGKGFFDGFPLASSVMASLHGVPMILSDEFNQNFFLNENEDFIKVKPEVSSVVNGIESLISNPEILAKMGEKGKKKIAEVHSIEKQLNKRIEIIKTTIS
jgi:glycosyltransferase involved in cell wall biosynthesis